MLKSDYFTTHPISGALGAEISGLDLSMPLNAAVFEQLHQALIEYKVLFFRDQDLTPEQHIAFGRMFGEPMEDEFVKEMDAHPELIELLQEADDSGYNFGGTWHSDSTYREQPPMGVALYARELPPFGGDTTWTNMELVYSSLSKGMQTLLDPLKAEHVAQGYREKMSIIKGDYTKSFNKEDIVVRNVSHPVVRKHPVSGNKSLYINEAYALRFSGMTEDESKPLIDYLCRFAIQPHFTCRFRWLPGSLALWDNRNTMHFAIGDYFGHRRLMHRYTIQGDTPVGLVEVANNG